MIKKFANLLQKIGNYEDVWSKLDKWNKGSITLQAFKQQLQKYRVGLSNEEINTIFSELMKVDPDSASKFRGKERRFNYR